MKTLWKNTLQLWTFGFLKIPMVFWLRPRLLELNNERAILKMPFVRRTKNHVNSMYFGALCAGADIVGGAHVMHFFNNKLDKLSFVFKDVNAQFQKRAEADVLFVCEEGPKIAATIARAKQPHERENEVIRVQAITRIDQVDEVVAQFTMTLSVRERARKSS